MTLAEIILAGFIALNPPEVDQKYFVGIAMDRGYITLRYDRNGDGTEDYRVYYNFDDHPQSSGIHVSKPVMYYDDADFDGIYRLSEKHVIEYVEEEGA